MVTREEVLAHIKQKYGANPEYLWARSPNFAVLRHEHNRKWFAAVIDITEDKLGLKSNKLVDAVLLKCETNMIFSLIDNKEVFFGYHMNKLHWITVHLSHVTKEKLFGLLDLSFQLTGGLRLDKR